MARNILRECSEFPFSLDDDLLPLVSYHVNNKMFFGYGTITFLHPLWITKYALTLESNEIWLKGECVARIEKWQEGYEENAYSREKLSAGTRLIVKNTWLMTLLRESQKALVISSVENRIWHEDYWSKKATGTAEGTRYTVYVQ